LAPIRALRFKDGDEMNHGRELVFASIFSMAVLALPAALGQDPGTKPASPAPATAGFDQVHGWLLDARRNFTAVQDYTCTLSKRENINGVLSDEHVIEAKFRTQPFSVYMRWLHPSKYYGQEVAFVAGRNNNKMRVHSKGLLKGAVGFVSLDVNDRRVLEQSRHTITEAGIGNVIEQALKHVDAVRGTGTGQVRTTEIVHDNRRCLRVEVIQSERRSQLDVWRTVLYLDKESKLPIRAETYGWPRQNAAADSRASGELLEQVSFTNLRWNVGLSDREFNK
jgi:hypothetical protein